jgi:hypothetical protein
MTVDGDFTRMLEEADYEALGNNQASPLRMNDNLYAGRYLKTVPAVYKTNTSHSDHPTVRQLCPPPPHYSMCETPVTMSKKYIHFETFSYKSKGGGPTIMLTA